MKAAIDAVLVFLEVEGVELLKGGDLSVVHLWLLPGTLVQLDVVDILRYTCPLICHLLKY